VSVRLIKQALGGDIIFLGADSPLDATPVGGPVSVTWRIDADGQVYYTISDVIAARYAWISPAVNAALYEFRWVTQGTDPDTVTGVSGTWDAMSSDKTFTENQTGSDRTALFTAELRRIAGPGPTIASVTISLQALGAP